MCVCGCVCGLTYVHTSVILYMKLMSSLAHTYNKTGINASDNSEFVWLCCSQLKRVNLNITPQDRVTIGPPGNRSPHTCSYFPDLSNIGVCTMCIEPDTSYRNSWDSWDSWSSEPTQPYLTLYLLLFPLSHWSNTYLQMADLVAPSLTTVVISWLPVWVFPVFNY